MTSTRLSFQSSLLHLLQTLDCHTSLAGELLAATSKPILLPKKTIIIHQGESPCWAFFLISGICHASYLAQDGASVTKEFYWEQELVFSFESVLLDCAYQFSVETLTPCSIAKIPVTFLASLRKSSHPFFQRLLERQLLFKEQKERTLLLHSAEARYLNFMEQFSDLVNRIPDYQLASYLGISPVSLCRIKKRLEQKRGST